jgi:hypothetical protein
MQAEDNAAVLGIGARQVAAILLLGVITCGPATAQVSPGALPPNLITPDALRPLVASMWRQSPTFRRQCARLAEHPDVVVRIELSVTMRHARARSALARQEGGLNAAVQIAMREPARYVERIAHELEHVLEHVDGADLPRLARQGLDGVVNSGGLYETARAQTVGRMVAREAVLQ